MNKQLRNRLDSELARRGLVASRSQAEQEIAFGHVAVNGRIVSKTSYLVSVDDKIRITKKNPYVSRAGLKLASVSKQLQLSFTDKVVLDVGSSTGGFTDYSLQHGAKKVIAVDVGTDQLHPKLRNDPRVELHEQTDIRNFQTDQSIDIVIIDVSFISLRAILPSINLLCKNVSTSNAQIVAMCKPQFEATPKEVNNGVIKNAKIRREILANFEQWLKTNTFVIQNKADSSVEGEKGNLERFYLLKFTK